MFLRYHRDTYKSMAQLLYDETSCFKPPRGGFIRPARWFYQTWVVVLLDLGSTLG